jgi:predicted nucleotidyltransferase component of viral defense system
MLATKMRALLQRNKGRDLYDLAHALEVFEGLDTNRVVECLALYLQKAGVRISRAEAEERMFAKLRQRGLLTDLRPLITEHHFESNLNDLA